VPELAGSASGRDLLDNRLVRDNLGLLASADLVATVEAPSSQLGTVTRLAAQFPDLKIVIDHFGWPEAGPGGTDLAGHMDRLAGLATAGNVATRIDAIGTIFGDWTLPQIRPWLLEVTGISMGINYGVNKVRFPAPVPVGAKIRLAASVAAAEPVGDGTAVQLTADFVVELDGGTKPACVAQAIYRYYA